MGERSRLNKAQAAKYLRVNREWFYTHLRRHPEEEPRHVIRGKRKYYAPEDLDRWLAQLGLAGDNWEPELPGGEDDEF